MGPVGRPGVGDDEIGKGNVTAQVFEGPGDHVGLVFDDHIETDGWLGRHGGYLYKRWRNEGCSG